MPLTDDIRNLHALVGESPPRLICFVAEKLMSKASRCRSDNDVVNAAAMSDVSESQVAVVRGGGEFKASR